MLHLSNISKTYAGNVLALQNIDLDIPIGMFGLLGPNGAGKSTLMRIIATLLTPDSGSIGFDGIDVLRDKTQLRKTLGYLPQEFGSYAKTSAQAMLMHFAALKGIHGSQRQQVVENLLVKTNLWEVRDRSVDKFSGGMKQRYGIAQALLGDPKLIIVDEPTAGLDPAERRRFQNLLVEIGEDKVVILSTHIVDDVAELCSSLAIMGQGKILAQGSPSQLLQALQGRLWQCVVGRDEAAKIRDKHKVISTRFNGGKLELRVLAETAPAGMTALTAELEDVYFSTLMEHGLQENME